MVSINTIEENGTKKIEIIRSGIFFKKDIIISKHSDNRFTVTMSGNTILETKKGEIIELKIETPIALAIFHPLWVGDTYNLFITHNNKEYRISESNLLTLLLPFSGSLGLVVGSFSYKEIQKIANYLNIKSPFPPYERVFRKGRSYVMNITLLIFLLIPIVIFLDFRIKSGLSLYEFISVLW